MPSSRKRTFTESGGRITIAHYNLFFIVHSEWIIDLNDKESSTN